MTEPADLVLTDAAVHTLSRPDEVHEAVAVRNGRIVRVGEAYDLDFLVGPDTRRIPLDDRVVLPGFVDAHTHLAFTGRRVVHADLAAVGSRTAALAALAERAAEIDDDEWLLGYGYDESRWDEAEPLAAADLDALDHPGPVAAFRVDLHVVSADTTALERCGLGDADSPDGTGDDPRPGVLTGSAAATVRDHLQPSPAEARRLVSAGQRRANERGVTAIHDFVRNSGAPRAYRDLAADGDLSVRVQLYYWRDHLDAVSELGLATGGGCRVRVGGIKSFSDGGFAARTARLSEPYADAPGDHVEWLVTPEELRTLSTRVDDLDLRMAVHAIGDEAVDATLDAYDACETPGEDRFRIEHAELASDDAVERMAATGVVACVQPNFLRWAGEGGLYEDRIGDRRRRTTRLRDLHDAGVPLAFGSDCMPLDPLLGVHHAVNAPAPEQRLEVTEALRAYTSGAAYAGFDEHRLGTVEPGKRADLVVLDRSPWRHPGAIDDVTVAVTVVDGVVVYDAVTGDGVAAGE